ncbi:MAG: hypothetical protein OJF49_000767 [Ktedonobacterales bacterium]|jgi:DNA-binding response OmpR family regulator|nr:MAG: hypothetical protein OJF49_000767 [Ktedonobacterales bacterium]
MSTSPGVTVLLIDDNVELLDLMTRSLHYIGHFTVERASDGVEGLEKAMALRPACIVVDVMMPGLNGYQFVRALRGDPTSAGIPIVMLTALAQDFNQLAGFLAGADHYLIKPVKIQELIAAIHEAITLSQSERDRRQRTLAEQDDGEGNHDGGSDA